MISPTPTTVERLRQVLRDQRRLGGATPRMVREQGGNHVCVVEYHAPAGTGTGTSGGSRVVQRESGGWAELAEVELVGLNDETLIDGWRYLAIQLRAEEGTGGLPLYGVVGLPELEVVEENPLQWFARHSTDSTSFSVPVEAGDFCVIFVAASLEDNGYDDLMIDGLSAGTPDAAQSGIWEVHHRLIESTGNLEVSWTAHGLSGVIVLRVRGTWLTTLDGTPAEDNSLDSGTVTGSSGSPGLQVGFVTGQEFYIVGSWEAIPGTLGNGQHGVYLNDQIVNPGTAEINLHANSFAKLINTAEAARMQLEITGGSPFGSNYAVALNYK